MARKRRWKIDPLTGIRYERGSLMDIASRAERNLTKGFDFTYNRPFKRKPRSYRRERYEYEGIDLSQLPPWAQALVAVIILAALFWIFVLPSLVNWVQQNWISISIVGLIIIFIWAFILARMWKQKKIREAKKRAFEQEQISKGLVKFVDRHGNEKWGKPEEVERWKKEDEEAKEKESLFYRVVKEIEEFTPAKEELRHEYNYQLNLHGWLKRTFPSAVIEKQKGSSRPDIVVDTIAIEIKGPTGRAELETIASKAMRYSHYYEGLIVVLFELKVSPQYYQEWLEGLKRHFPNVRVIVK
ncbi:MAG: FeoB-associated Cys-rich membrane protein [Candidatus Aenigmatarchaeota archaeon]